MLSSTPFCPENLFCAGNARRALLFFFVSALGAAQGLNCDLKDYKPAEGLTAAVRSGALEFSWQGERNEELRARFTIHDGQPVVDELAARKAGGNWIVLGRNLTPEFEVTSGKRQIGRAHV